MMRFSVFFASAVFLLMSLLVPSSSAQTACAPSWQVGISITTGKALPFNGDNWQGLQSETQTVDGWQPSNIPAPGKYLGPYSGSGGGGGGLTRERVSPVCVTASGNKTFDNSSFPSQSGAFTTTTDMTPSSGAISAVIGISHGVQTGNTSFANIVALSTTGFFQVRDGGTYFTSTIHYAAGVTSHIRLAIDVTTRTDSAFVTTPGGTEQTIRAGAAFRTEQNSVTSLDHWAVNDSLAGSTLAACNFSVQ